MSKVVQPSPVEGLFLLPSGPIPPNPSELLNSPRFEQMGRELMAQGFDHVIYDSPPVLSVADPVIIASVVDSVILVVRASSTPRQSVSLAVERLAKAGRGTTGVVLNDLDMESRGSNYYRYYYTSGPDTPRLEPPETPRKQAGGNLA